MKKRSIIITTSLAISLLVGLIVSQLLRPEDFTKSFSQDESQFRKAATKSLSPYAAFGDSSFVLMTEVERTGNHYIE